MVLREQVWVDRNVQGALIARIVMYWGFALLYVGLGSACYQYYRHPDWTVLKHSTALFDQFWPWLPSAVLCLPLVIFDIVRLSNLFVGPIYRLRHHLDELNDDPNCRPLKFRDDDFWHDLVAPMHCLQSELQMLRAEVVRLRQQQVVPRSTAAAAPQIAARQVATAAPLDLSQVDLDKIKKMLPPIGATFEPSRLNS
jgi:hypothetical protein